MPRSVDLNTLDYLVLGVAMIEVYHKFHLKPKIVVEPKEILLSICMGQPVSEIIDKAVKEF